MRNFKPNVTNQMQNTRIIPVNIADKQRVRSNSLTNDESYSMSLINSLSKQSYEQSLREINLANTIFKMKEELNIYKSLDSRYMELLKENEILKRHIGTISVINNENSSTELKKVKEDNMKLRDYVKTCVPSVHLQNSLIELEKTKNVLKQKNIQIENYKNQIKPTEKTRISTDDEKENTNLNNTLNSKNTNTSNNLSEIILKLSDIEKILQTHNFDEIEVNQTGKLSIYEELLWEFRRIRESIEQN